MTLAECRDRWSKRKAFALVELGMDAETFWDMTQREIAHYTERWKHHREHDEYMIGQLTAVTANFSMCRPKKPLSPLDFMPSRRETKERKTRINRKIIAEQLRSSLSSLAALAGGNHGQ